MARVIAIGQSANDSERLAIRHLREHLPDNYTLLHNLEIERGGQHFEVDLAVIAPHAVYLVDVKGTRGLISVYGSEWHPPRGAPFPSPLLKIRAHARALKGLIADADPADRGLKRIYVDAAVLLTHPQARLNDQAGADAPDVARLEDAAKFFQDESRIPDRFDTNVAPYYKRVLNVLKGHARAARAVEQYGAWRVVEHLGDTDAYAEYRAFNAEAGEGSGRVRLRVYKTDPYASEGEREAERERVRNAYRALGRLSAHPAIVGARDFFFDDGAAAYVLVTDDVTGQALRVHLERPEEALTPTQRRTLVRHLLESLDHAHASGVVHRNVSPSTVLMAEGGQFRLSAFDYARSVAGRTRTIADEIVDVLDYRYQAPECYREPAAATPASDVFSAGAVLYEVFSGQVAFPSPEALVDGGALFATAPSSLADLPERVAPATFDAWLQRLCDFNAADRPTAAQALADFEALFARDEEGHLNATVQGDAADGGRAAGVPDAAAPNHAAAPDYTDLPTGHRLTRKLIVRERLGKPGGFAVAYKVFDCLAERECVVKIVVKDRVSTVERLKQEYRVLLDLPPHEYVAQVLDADFLADGTPYLVFSYVNGFDVRQLVEDDVLSLHEAWEMAKQAAEGLIHLHRHGVFHCDVKPSNLIWTGDGVRIIDFNVAVTTASYAHGGGSRRYLPPDLDLSGSPDSASGADRDAFALGVTLYEAATGRYPWEGAVPPPGREPKSPSHYARLHDLSSEAAAVMLKAIAPRRAQRYASAAELLEALRGVKTLRRISADTSEDAASLVSAFAVPGDGAVAGNPFVSYLRTLYSQSKSSNAGTRGLDEQGKRLYVRTLLDRELRPAVLSGEFRLVIVTGNAGDGKTAFLQNLEGKAAAEGAEVTPNPNGNGAWFELGGRRFVSNYDGSQDEGDTTNDEVLRAFFDAYEGGSAGAWPTDETRLIAINEGRLIDFLESEGARFRHLRDVVLRGLITGEPRDGVAVVNLNLRSVTASPTDAEGEGGSILRRLLERFTAPALWQACASCPIGGKCYAYHNARTFADEQAGPVVAERLETLYRLATLRNRLHITLRDLGSALAYTLTSDRDCASIAELHASGNAEVYLNGFYFNAWMGGESGSADRLLSLLKEADVGAATDPRLDRYLDFRGPEADDLLLDTETRPGYDRELLQTIFERLPRIQGGHPDPERRQAHQRYVAFRRRLAYFERRDDRWREMLPYEAAARMLELLRGERDLGEAKGALLQAIDRGEGLIDPERLGGDLALQVREVEGGTIRSYRVFPADRFSLEVASAVEPRFVEHEPTALALRYDGPEGHRAELTIDLDVFEMLDRLNRGYRPTPDELQGYHLALAVFKNVLGSAPYREVLLTPHGHEFYRVARLEDGRLRMAHVGGEEGEALD